MTYLLEKDLSVSIMRGKLCHCLKTRWCISARAKTISELSLSMAEGNCFEHQPNCGVGLMVSIMSGIIF